MKHSIHLITMLALLVLGISAGTVNAARATRVENAIWAHDHIYDTVVTDTSFSVPPSGSTDIIYSFMLSGLDGQRSVAETAPGDPEFNGGRWDVHLVTFTPAGLAAHDPDGDGLVNFELTNAEDLLLHEELGHLVVNRANFYFECPMLPNRGIR